MMVRSLFLATLVLLSGQAVALIETYDFSDPALEARYQQLSEELRCPKCQNQNIAGTVNLCAIDRALVALPQCCGWPPSCSCWQRSVCWWQHCARARKLRIARVPHSPRRSKPACKNCSINRSATLDHIFF